MARPSTALGNWYATALFWKPQAALFLNERTLLPVFLPLAPAANLADRFPDQLGRVMDALGIPIEFVLQEVGVMDKATFAKTASRSLLASMNALAHRSGWTRHYVEDDDMLLTLSLDLAKMPCGPLFKRHISPNRELAALVSKVLGE